MICIRKVSQFIFVVVFLAPPLLGQGKRLWVLLASGERGEYDSVSFAVKQTVKVPTEAVQTPLGLSVNHMGQILFVPLVNLPLAEDDVRSEHRVWLWNGRAASTLDQGVKREVTARGSNQAIAESAPT